MQKSKQISEPEEGSQGCLLSPTLFNIFLERIMYEALDDHEGSISIGRRLIINFRFADDIVVNAGVLIDRLDRTTTRYKMEIGPDDKSDDKQP